MPVKKSPYHTQYFEQSHILPVQNPQDFLTIQQQSRIQTLNGNRCNYQNLITQENTELQNQELTRDQNTVVENFDKNTDQYLPLYSLEKILLDTQNVSETLDAILEKNHHELMYIHETDRKLQAQDIEQLYTNNCNMVDIEQWYNNCSIVNNSGDANTSSNIVESNSESFKIFGSLENQDSTDTEYNDDSLESQNKELANININLQDNELLDFNNRITTHDYGENYINIKSSLPKATTKTFDLVKEQNEKFTNKLKLLNINIDPKKYVLDKRQKTLVEKMGKSFLPTGLRKDLIEFLSLQICKHTHAILEKKSHSFDYGIVFAPKCYRIQNSDNFIIRIAKYNIFNNLKINTNIAHYRVTDMSEKNSTEVMQYLIGCLDKIDNITDKKEPEIFLFIPDFIFNSDSSLKSSLKTLSLRIAFYSEIEYLPDFFNGIYKFTVRNTQDQKCLYIEDKTKDINALLVDHNLVLEALEDLKDRARKKLVKIQNVSLYQNIRSYTDDLNVCDEKTKYYINKRINKIYKRKAENIDCHTPLKKSKNNLFVNETKFQEINELIAQKYLEEKAQNIYNVKHLIDSKVFHNSTFQYFKTIEEEKTYFINVLYDIKRLCLDPKWILEEKDNYGIILLPMKFHIDNQKNDEKQIQDKISSLSNAKIQKAHFMYLAKTQEKFSFDNPDENKFVISLLDPINVADAETDDQIIVILPKCFEKDKPLFDPNQFALRTYFYNIVRNYYSSLGYPLYEFYIHTNFNLKNQEVDNTRQDYLKKVKDIKDVTLEEYMIDSYQLIDERVLTRAKQLQAKARLNAL